MSQLPLPIAWSRRGGRESLLVHEGNRAAVAALRTPALWPSHCAILAGPARSGRSLVGELVESEGGITVIDDADEAPEQSLFHAWNNAKDAGHTLLLIAREAPPVWQVALPDLRTRLATAAIVRIEPPDEAVSAALIAHGLELAGSAFAPDVPEFLARRTARCYEAVDAVVARLNAVSLSSGGKLSIASARQALCNNPVLDETPDQ